MSTHLRDCSAKRMSEQLNEKQPGTELMPKEAALLCNSSAETVPIGGSVANNNTKVVLSVGESTKDVIGKVLSGSYDNVDIDALKSGESGGVINETDFAIVQNNEKSCLDLDQKTFEMESAKMMQVLVNECAFDQRAASVQANRYSN